MSNVTCTMTCLYPGGYDIDHRDKVLEFRPETEEWSLAGRMVHARYDHAVSTIILEDVNKYCN